MKLTSSGIFSFLRPRHIAMTAMVCGVMTLSGCSIGNIGVYKPEVLQGNFISKEQAAAVQVGMNRMQVRQIMGTPLVTDLFRSDRWDYIFTVKNRRGLEQQKYAVTVRFAGDLVSRIEGRDDLPTEQDFVGMLGGDKTYKPRNLEATPEQLQRFAERNKPVNTAQPTPDAPAATSYAPLPQ